MRRQLTSIRLVHFAWLIPRERAQIGLIQTEISRCLTLIWPVSCVLDQDERFLHWDSRIILANDKMLSGGELRKDGFYTFYIDLKFYVCELFILQCANWLKSIECVHIDEETLELTYRCIEQ